MDQHKRCEIFLISPMYQRILLKILLIAITATLTSSTPSTPPNPSCRKGISDWTQCACEGQENFLISCTNNLTILISDAFYGRNDNITCNAGNVDGKWNFSCPSKNLTKDVSERCNNRTNCSFGQKGNYNSLFGDPCPGTGKYLLVNYTCVSDQTTTSTISSGCSCSIEQKRDITWQNTVCGSNLTQICPNNNNSEMAYRWCSKNGTWSDPNLKGCTREEIKQISKETESLRANFTASAAKDKMARVESISKSNDLRGGDLFELTNSMVQIGELSQNNSKCFSLSDAEDFSIWGLISTSKVLSNTSNEAWDELSPSEQSITATRILVVVEDSLAVLAAVTNTTNTTKKKAPGIGDVQIDVIDINSISEADLKATITFRVDAGTSQANGNNNGAQLEHVHDVHLEISREDVKKHSSRDGLGRVVFILYDDIEKRLTMTSKNDSLENNKAAENGSYSEPSIITKVVSVSIISDKEHSTDLINPIKFTLRHKSHPLNSYNASCVFWKFSKIDFVGQWSSEGCKVVSSNEYYTTCECSHLTNFAVLMSTANKTISDQHKFALQVLTNIGCAISIVCLALALFIFCYFRNLQSDRNTIHKNLVFSLLIAQLIFVFGITPYNNSVGDNNQTHKTLCAVVAGFLHYFFLASFAWMCLEGVQLYVLLVEVFEIEKSRVKWYYLGGYGIPALIVLISVIINNTMMSGEHGGYGTKEYCWLNKDMDFVWAFNGPVIAVFVMNLVMLGLAIYMMCKHASAASCKLKEKSKIYKIGSWLRGAAILVVLLGTTWIFGIFLIFDKETLIFEYIFTILNSLQGLFIFVFHCLINEKVQQEFQRAIRRSSWLPECVREMFRDWGESGSPSFTSQSSSSGKQSKRRESTMSDSSLRKLVSTSSDSSVRVTLSTTQEETWPSQVKAASESTCLTDSSGYSDHLDTVDSSEDLRGYRESVISGVNEGRFNIQHQIE